MQFSHSRVECFNQCPYKYKLRYIDELSTLPDDAPDNALYLGTALHTAIQVHLPEAIEEFYSNYPVINDEIITEAIKLEIMGNKARQTVPEDGQAEVLISNKDFKGFIDWLVPARTEQSIAGEHQIIPFQYDLYDFKYSNNDKRYMDSDQLHLYKYYFEKMHPGQYIRNLYFLFVPKLKIKQGKDEQLEDYRRRVIAECEQLQPYLKKVEYQPEKVIEFLSNVKHTLEEKNYDKKQQFLCKWCEYQPYCIEGKDYIMNLPKNERRKIDTISKKVLWIYGSPFCGKTTFANQFPDPLMLNTDGNIKFVDAPYIRIKDEVTVTGRLTTRKFAWEIFKEVIAELEKKQNDFKTIIVDLLEDTYEHCRLYMYDQLGITHESDDSFRAWDKVRTEFLSTLKKLMNLDYENIILISHEDTSRDLTKKSGDKISAIKPNMNDKVSNKVAGMVDIVARVVAEDNVRTLSFKNSEVVFGGGRLTVNAREIPLDYEAFLTVYEDKGEPVKVEEEPPKRTRERKAPEEPVVEEEPTPMMGADEPEEPKRTRRRTSEEPVQEEKLPFGDEPVQETTQTTRRRRTRA
jgi:phage nucleotide-binding protein